MNNSYILAFVSLVIMFTGMEDYKVYILACNLSWRGLTQKLMKNYAHFATIVVVNTH